MVTAATKSPAFLLPTPPEKIDPNVVDAVTVRWDDIESGDDGAKSRAIETVLHGLREEGLAFIEMTPEQKAKWDAAVEAALAFFALPEEDKMACRCEDESGKFVGYLSQPKREMFQASLGFRV